MSARQFPQESAGAEWATGAAVPKVVAKMSDGMIFHAYGTTTPNAVAGYAVGCLFQNTLTGVLSSNTGTTTSCTFTAAN